MLPNTRFITAKKVKRCNLHNIGLKHEPPPQLGAAVLRATLQNSSKIYILIQVTEITIICTGIVENNDKTFNA
jgi:hypothetical protein